MVDLPQPQEIEEGRVLIRVTAVQHIAEVPYNPFAMCNKADMCGA